MCCPRHRVHSSTRYLQQSLRELLGQADGSQQLHPDLQKSVDQISAFWAHYNCDAQ